MERADSIDLVVEFLEFHGFRNSLAALKQEVNETEEKDISEGKKIDVLNYFLHLFSDGDAIETQRYWEKHISSEIRETIEAQQLEFYIQIYFAIFPIHPAVSQITQQSKEKLKESMKEFKNYLENKAPDFSSTQEFLPFYALPYLPNPGNNPSFKELFAPEWIDSLHHRYENFLNQNISVTKPPRLYSLLGNMGSISSDNPEKSTNISENNSREAVIPSENTQEIESYKQQLDSLMLLLKDVGMCVREVSTQVCELINFTESLQLNSNENVERKRFVSNHMSRYNQLLSFWSSLTQSSKPFLIEINPSENSESTLPNLPVILLADRPPINNIIPYENAALIDASLDYQRMFRDIYTLPEEKAARIFQALRFRLTSNASSSNRRQILSYLVGFDIFSAKSNSSSTNDVFSQFILSENDLLRESVCRLINTVATDAFGRTYLLKHQNMIKYLFAVLNTESSDNSIRQNALGALQKFSLGRIPQSKMIALGIMEWIVSQLKLISPKTFASHNLSPYTIEYSSALLMNLSLRTLGKIRAEKFAILPVLKDLLLYPDAQVRTYINGTVYSLLSRAKLRGIAISLGFKQLITRLRASSEEPFSQQLDFMLQELRSNAPNDPSEDSQALNQEELDEEEDIGEESIEFDEDIDEFVGTEFSNLPKGDLLLSNYVGSKDIINANIAAAKSSFENGSIQNNLLQLPVQQNSKFRQSLSWNGEVISSESNLALATLSPNKLNESVALRSSNESVDLKQVSLKKSDSAIIRPVTPNRSNAKANPDDPFNPRPKVPRTPPARETTFQNPSNFAHSLQMSKRKDAHDSENPRSSYNYELESFDEENISPEENIDTHVFEAKRQLLRTPVPQYN